MAGIVKNNFHIYNTFVINMFNLTENDLGMTRIKFCQEVPNICNRSYNVPSEFEIPSTASEKFEELDYLHTEDTELLNAVNTQITESYADSYKDSSTDFYADSYEDSYSDLPNNILSENSLALNDGKLMNTKSPEDCWMICRLTLHCEGFTWTDSYAFPKNVRNSCWLKKSLNGKVFQTTMSDDPHTISGLRNWF
jgi:hypothetical protein